MARRQESSIRDALTSVISPQLIRGGHKAFSGETCPRVDIVALIHTIVLGFDRGAKRTLASLRRAYTMTTERRWRPSAFYDRSTPALADGCES
jgi:hypothetical protein